MSFGEEVATTIERLQEENAKLREEVDRLQMAIDCGTHVGAKHAAEALTQLGKKNMELEGEVERLKEQLQSKELDPVLNSIADADFSFDEMEILQKENTRLRACLEQLEWIDDGNCPLCGQFKRKAWGIRKEYVGHKTDCQLGQALNRCAAKLAAEGLGEVQE